MPWPSVEEQITAAQVDPESPLAQLIRENQDLSLLQPSEANDERGLPGWIRVYWRKQHPEMESVAGDPTGGYPRALDNLYRWMLTHPSLEPEPPPAPTPPPPPEESGRGGT